MPEGNVKIGETKLTFSGEADLSKFLDVSSPEAVFELVGEDFLQNLDKTLDEVGGTELMGGLKVDSPLKWDLGGKTTVTLAFDAKPEGGVEIRKSGNLLTYKRADPELGPEKVEEIPVPVPAGYAYFSVHLLVSLGVKSGASFSSGSFGVKGNLDSSIKFRVSNHKCLPLDMRLSDAITAAFEDFVLPFKAEDIGPADVERMRSDDYLDYEFAGTLKLGLGLTYGVGNIFFGGRSASEVKKSFESPIGSVVAKASTPSLKARAAYDFKYSHESVFRVLVGRVEGQTGQNRLTLFLFRQHRTEISNRFSAAITINTGADLKIKSKLDKLIDESADELFGKLEPDVRKPAIKTFREVLKGEKHKRELDKYVKDANRKIAKLIEKVDGKSTRLEVKHESLDQETILFNYEFDLANPLALGQGFAHAVRGDYVKAVQVDGVDLLPGSYVEELHRSRTTISFQLFDIFRLTSSTDYFKKHQVIYAGHGVFRLRYSTGVKYETDNAGRGKAVEIYFLAKALTAGGGTFQTPEVTFHFDTLDKGQPREARMTSKVLKLISDSEELSRLIERLTDLIEEDEDLHVRVRATLKSSAFSKISSTDFVDGKPSPLPHAEDENNWNRFVSAVDRLYKERGFKTQGFPNLAKDFDEWVRYNRTVNYDEDSPKPPNRRWSGNPFQWPQGGGWLSVPATGDRAMIATYLNAGRQFMNLCDDLRHLAKDLNAPDKFTEERFEDLLNNLDELIKNNANVWFTKPTLLALDRISQATVGKVSGPPEGEEVDEEFEIAFELV